MIEAASCWRATLTPGQTAWRSLARPIRLDRSPDLLHDKRTPLSANSVTPYPDPGRPASVTRTHSRLYVQDIYVSYSETVQVFPTRLWQPHARRSCRLGSAAPEVAGLEAQAPASAIPYTHRPGGAGTRRLRGAVCVVPRANLDDGAYGPPLKGLEFRQKWGPRPPKRSSRTPASGCRRPAGLARRRELRAASGVHPPGKRTKPGTRELPADPDALSAMAVPGWPRAGEEGWRRGVRVPPPPPGSIHWTRFARSPRTC